MAMAKPPTHLSFLSTIVKGWHRSDNGPAFGDDLVIDAKISKSRAHLGSFYSIPTSVKDKYAILKGPGTYFLPDKVEVFYLDPSC